MGGGSPKTTTQVTKSEPPSYAIPYLKEAASEAQRLYETQTPQYYPESTVVPFSNETEQALQGITQRAITGSPLVDAAQQANLTQLNSQYSNPYLSGAVQAATAPIYEQFANQTLPDLRSAFASVGRSGSGREEAALQQAITNFGRGIGEQGARLAFTSAENQAMRNLDAQRLAPQLAQQDYADLGLLEQVGAKREGLSQAQLQDDINRFNFSQNIQADQLNQLINQLQGTVQGYGTATAISPVSSPNKFLTGAGGALSGAATGAAIGSVVPGIGTGIGAAVGGGLGLLGGVL